MCSLLSAHPFLLPQSNEANLFFRNWKQLLKEIMSNSRPRNFKTSIFNSIMKREKKERNPQNDSIKLYFLEIVCSIRTKKKKKTSLSIPSTVGQNQLSPQLAKSSLWKYKSKKQNFSDVLDIIENSVYLLYKPTFVALISKSAIRWKNKLCK